MKNEFDELDEMDPSRLSDEIDAQETASKKPKEEELPAVTTIEVDVTDGRGKRYAGSFVYNVPPLGAQLKVARLKATLLPAGAPTDVNGALIAEMMAYCEITLGKPRPAWWKPHTFFDMVPLAAVYGRCRAYEARFLGAEEPADDGRSDSSEVGDRLAADGEDDVERRVQAPAERRETLVAHSSRGVGAGDRARSPR